MSDYTNRSKPILELIGALGGRSCGVNIMSGSGGIASLTDQDIAGAVAMARQYKQADKKGRRPEAPVAACCRPELLMLHYAGRSDLVPLVARRCAEFATDHKDRRMMRAASLLAAQLMSGRKIDVEVSAWLLDTTVKELEREIDFGLAWMRGELSEAESAYCNAMRRMIDEREDGPRQVCRFGLAKGKLKLVMVAA